MSSDWGKNDDWAGAVKACHDMGSSLPSQEQLTALANELYDAPISGSTTTNEYANRDNDLAVSMGFMSSPSNSFRLWSSEEKSKDTAYSRSFYSTHTSRSFGRIGSSIQAVCLAE